MTLGNAGVSDDGVRSHECACGERIVSISSHPDDVGQAVASHNAMRVHQRWLVLHGMVDGMWAAPLPPEKRCPCGRDLEAA